MPHWTDDDTQYLPDGWNEAITSGACQHKWLFEINDYGQNGGTHLEGLDLIDMTPVNKGNNPQDSFFSIGDLELTVFDAATWGSVYNTLQPWEDSQIVYFLKLTSELNDLLDYVHDEWAIVGVEKVNSKVTKIRCRSIEEALERYMVCCNNASLFKIEIPGNTGKVVDSVTFLNNPPIQRWIMWWVTSTVYELYSDIFGYLGNGSNGAVNTFVFNYQNVVTIDMTSLAGKVIRLGTRVGVISKYENWKVIDPDYNSISDTIADILSTSSVGPSIDLTDQDSFKYAQVFRPKVKFEDAMDVHRATRVLCEYCGGHYQVNPSKDFDFYMLHGRRPPASWYALGLDDVLGEGTSHKPSDELDISNVVVRFQDEDNQYSITGFPNTLQSKRTMLLQFDHARRGDAEVIAEYTYKVFKKPRRIYGFKTKARGISLEPLEIYQLTMTEPPLSAVPILIFAKSISRDLSEVSFQALDISDLYDANFFLSGTSNFASGDKLW